MKVQISRDTRYIITDYINNRYDHHYMSYSIRRIHIADSIMEVTMSDDKTYNIPLREL